MGRLEESKICKHCTHNPESIITLMHGVALRLFAVLAWLFFFSKNNQHIGFKRSLLNRITFESQEKKASVVPV